MHTASRNSLCLALTLFLAFTPVLRAQQSTTTPVPPQLTAAHNVFVSNGGGSNYFDQFTGGPDRAYNSLYADLQSSARYQLVSSPAQADVIFEVKSIAPAVSTSDGSAYNPQIILSVIDPPTHTVLWTTSANVRAAGGQTTRDREFDESLDVALDKLGAVTGEQLTPQQAKAIRSNSAWRMSTAAKVILAVGIAATAGLTAYGTYRVTHPPTLTQPALPNSAVFP